MKDINVMNNKNFLDKVFSKLVFIPLLSALFGILLTYIMMMNFFIDDLIIDNQRNTTIAAHIKFAEENIKFIRLLENKEYCLAYKEIKSSLSKLNNPLIESCSRGKQCWKYFQNESNRIMSDINKILYMTDDSENECNCIKYSDETSSKCSS